MSKSLNRGASIAPTVAMRRADPGKAVPGSAHSEANGTYLTAIVRKSTRRHGLLLPEIAVNTSM